jgi:hypothetical protein
MLIDNHICSIINCQEPCCLGDYQRLQKQLITQEQFLLSQINNSLELGLSSVELTCQKVISRLEELIRKPQIEQPKLEQELVVNQKIVKLLQPQLADQVKNSIQQAEYQKILQLIKNDTYQSCSQLKIIIPQLVKENIKKATTIERVLTERNSLIAGQLSQSGAELKMIAQQKENLTQSQNQER